MTAEAWLAMSISETYEHGEYTVTVGARTDIGKVRKVNEDSYCVSPRVWAVSDGMGGHQAGDVASAIVVSVCETTGTRERLEVADVEAVVVESNAAVRREADESDNAGMGATLVGAALADNGGDPAFVVFNVGDSRCYEIVDDEPMRQVTTDHSLVQEMVDAGQITSEEADRHPQRNVITRGIGIDPVVQTDLVILGRSNRRLILCSDGVSGEIDRGRMEALARSAPDAAAAADALLAAALEGPARDNATVMVLEISASERATEVDESTGPRPTVVDETTAPRDALPVAEPTEKLVTDVPENTAADDAEPEDERTEPLIAGVPGGGANTETAPAESDAAPANLIDEVPQ